MVPRKKAGLGGSNSTPVRLCPIYLHCHRRLICAISDDSNTIVSQAESITSASGGQNPSVPSSVCESLPRPVENPIRLLLVARRTLFRAAVRMLLESHPVMNVIDETAEIARALEIAAREQPDIVLVEPTLQLNSNLEVITELRKISQKARVIIFTNEPANVFPQELIASGVRGFLCEDTTPFALFKAIEKVHAGEVWFERRIMAQALDRQSHETGTNSREFASRIDSLTQRERDVIALVCEGLKNKQIANRLFISDTTVHHHLSSVYAKLGVSDRLELVIYAYRQGLVKLPSS